MSEELREKAALHERLHDSLVLMANRCSVDMLLWDKHCNVVLEAVAALSANEGMRKSLEWQPIATAPRDGSYVWLWNKHVSNPWEAPQPFRWSTHYSVFGLGGCWTDGLCTMGDVIDFDFWCAVLPAKHSNPYETIGNSKLAPAGEGEAQS